MGCITHENVTLWPTRASLSSDTISRRSSLSLLSWQTYTNHRKKLKLCLHQQSMLWKKTPVSGMSRNIKVVNVTHKE